MAQYKVLCSTAGLLTFSSIFERGPPPPSPFPKTSSAVSEDSKFCGKPIPLLSPSHDEERDVFAYFVIGEAFADISEGGLRCVRVWVDFKKRGE